MTLTTCLWFDDQAEAAVNFYVSLLRDTKLGDVSRYGKDAAEVAGRPEGSVLTAAFEAEGQHFMALNGGPVYQFTPAVSFVVTRDTQEELDAVWEPLADGGNVMQCGWVTDRFGVTWQVIPSSMSSWLGGADAAGASRAMQAMLTMKKIDIAAMQAAYDGE